jgi:hypothetical protein
VEVTVEKGKTVFIAKSPFGISQAVTFAASSCAPGHSRRSGK